MKRRNLVAAARSACAFSACLLFSCAVQAQQAWVPVPIGAGNQKGQPSKIEASHRVVADARPEPFRYRSGSIRHCRFRNQYDKKMQFMYRIYLEGEDRKPYYAAGGVVVLNPGETSPDRGETDGAAQLHHLDLEWVREYGGPSRVSPAR
jgi:hypothetical protein